MLSSIDYELALPILALRADSLRSSVLIRFANRSAVQVKVMFVLLGKWFLSGGPPDSKGSYGLNGFSMGSSLQIS